FLRSVCGQFGAFRVGPCGIPEARWHVAPARQLVILLTGWLLFEASHGENRRCDPGAVILAADTFGTSHLTQRPGEQFVALFVPDPDGLSACPSSEGIKC